MRLSAVYKSPNTSLLTSDLDALFNTNSDKIIEYDFNAKHTAWNCRVINTAGRTLKRYLDSRLDTSVDIPLTPTYYPDIPYHHFNALIIDLTKITNINFQLTNFPADHFLIILNLKFNASHASPLKKIKKLFSCY